MFIFCCSIFYQVTVKSNDTDQDVICMRGKNLKIEITITDEYSLRKLRALTYTGLNSETLFVSVLIQHCVNYPGPKGFSLYFSIEMLGTLIYTVFS